MRKGLHPLAAHIGLAASAEGGADGVVLQEGLERSESLKAMLLGIQKYQQHPHPQEIQPLEDVYQLGTVKLRAIPGYEPITKDQPVMVLVPSMVNKAYILDLLPDRSLMRWLGQQGIMPYLLDWGDVTQDPGQADINGIIMKRLVPMIRHAAAMAGRPVHVMGYCMGGTLLAGAALHAVESIKSLIFLAAPWDFHAGTRSLLDRVKFWAPSAFPLIAEKGVLPVDWMQMLFASLNPHSSEKKFAAFVDMAPESEEARLFVAVEDWLNDGTDFPSAVAQQCIKEWFFENSPARSEWQVGGRFIHPEDFQCPALIVASDKDRLVEQQTAVALADQMKQASTINPSCGHIGMIAGGQAVVKVWTPIAEWVFDHK